MMNKRNAYEEEIDAQLKEWDAQIALLQAQAEKAKAGEKIGYYKTIEALQHKQDEIKAKLHVINAASDVEGIDTT